jgi:F420-dependent oxidoreductase-like protein
MQPIRFGVIVPQGWRMDLTEIASPGDQYDAMAAVAQQADRLESCFESIWLYDHFHTIPEPALESTFECWTTTAALARETRRVKVGQIVTCLGFRHPAVLAKMASTADALSHGRLIVGLGAGWYAQEAHAYGLPLPETRVRMAMFGEACELIHRMWTEDQPEFEGRYYQVSRPINRPRAVQMPHPPLWIGGGGERVTLRLVARWGDACNFGGSPDEIRHKLDVLRRHCDALGRDFETITRSTLVEEVYLVDREDQIAAARERVLRTMPAALAAGLLVGTPDDVARHLLERRAAGMTYFVIYFRRAAYEPDQLERFARYVAPQVSAP